MHCIICKIEAPKTLGKIGDTWLCPSCSDKLKDGNTYLKILMEHIYHCANGSPDFIRLVYVSDLDNNLDKINKHFKECVDLDNPLCTITLCRADTYKMLRGKYDYLFIDDDILDKQDIIKAIDKTPNALVCFIHGTAQTIVG